LNEATRECAANALCTAGNGDDFSRNVHGISPRTECAWSMSQRCDVGRSLTI
jgi:hypothetical protein